VKVIDVKKESFWNSLWFSWISFIFFYLLFAYGMYSGLRDGFIIRVIFSCFCFLFMTAILFFGKDIKRWYFEVQTKV
jgi:hypothetical protein